METNKDMPYHVPGIDSGILFNQVNRILFSNIFSFRVYPLKIICLTLDTESGE